MRDTFNLDAMQSELIRDEGLVLHVYKDPGSGRAIGVGRNLDTQGLSVAELDVLLGAAAHLGVPLKGDEAVDVFSHPDYPLSRDEAMLLLTNDIADRAHQLDVYIPWWRLLSPCRQRVLLNMAFEMGSHGMLKDQASAIMLIQQGEFKLAAEAMMETGWGRGKTHNRASRLASMLNLDSPPL